MYLFELQENTKLTHIIAVTDQLKTALDKGEIKSNWDTKTLLDYFRKYNVILSKDDLFNMIQKKPLKKVIRNIEGDTVIFRGMPGTETSKDNTTTPEKSKEVVSKMAKKTLKK